MLRDLPLVYSCAGGAEEEQTPAWQTKQHGEGWGKAL